MSNYVTISAINKVFRNNNNGLKFGSSKLTGWADFDINETGHLIFTKTDNLETEFTLTDSGRLEVTLV